VRLDFRRLRMIEKIFFCFFNTHLVESIRTLPLKILSMVEILACGNSTLRIEITIVRVVVTLVCVKMILMCVEITHVEILLTRVLRLHSFVTK
jgi:transcription elongation factor Elf1